MERQVIAFVDRDGERKWLRFGRLNKREFGIVKTRVDRLVSAMLSGDTPDRETTVWLNGVSDYVRGKLAAAGLVEARRSKTLGEWVKDLLAKRTDLKETSLLVYRRCETRLVEYFTEEKSLRAITAEDAADWRRWLATIPLADNTVRKMTGVARQFFASAQRARLIDENPFWGLVAAVREVEERFVFVTHDASMKILNACPDDEWRLIWSLLRWGGLRCPSEIRALRLDGIDWDGGRLTVWSPKTEHHEGQECRIIPIFPEIRPWLEKAFDDAPDGSVYVIQRRKAFRNHMETIIRRAGLVPWGKLFQNLRSTRETELAETYPIHVVVKWMGNSQAIARRHYLQVNDAHFAKALGEAPQFAPHHQPNPSGNDQAEPAPEMQNGQDFS